MKQIEASPSSTAETFSAFLGTSLVTRGTRETVGAAARGIEDERTLLVFDDTTGRVADLDAEGMPVSRGGPAVSDEGSEMAEPRGRGRPRLGVQAREVTLLPRHWQWLAAQPGGASATIRRLVDAARREENTSGRARMAREAAYRFMSAIGGDLPGFEEAARSLFAGDGAGFARNVAAWPADVAAHAITLARDGLTSER